MSHNPNKWVVSRRLNCRRLSDCLSSVGKEWTKGIWQTNKYWKNYSFPLV